MARQLANGAQAITPKLSKYNDMMNGGTGVLPHTPYPLLWSIVLHTPSLLYVLTMLQRNSVLYIFTIHPFHDVPCLAASHPRRLPHLPLCATLPSLFPPLPPLLYAPLPSLSLLPCSLSYMPPTVSPSLMGHPTLFLTPPFPTPAGTPSPPPLTRTAYTLTLDMRASG